MTLSEICRDGVLLFLMLIPASFLSAQEVESTMPRRTSRLMPLVAYEFGTPQSIQRFPGIVNRGEFGAEGTGRSLDQTAIFGLEFLFPRVVRDAFGLSVQISLAESDGWFESDTFTDTTSAVDRLTGGALVSTNMFDVETSETQGRIALLGTWDFPGMRLSVGPWAGYRVSSQLLQTERIIGPDQAVFESNGEISRIIGADNPIASFRWRFGGTARLSHDLPLSSTFALVPFAGVRFDGESLFDRGLGLRAFSARVGLGFSVSWRPDPIEELELLLAVEEQAAAPRFRLQPSSNARATVDPTEDTIVVGELHTVESYMVGFPDELPVQLLAALPQVDTTRLPTTTSLSTLPIDDLLTQLPALLTARMREDTTLRLTIVPQQGDEGGAERAGRVLYELLVLRGGIDPARVSLAAVETGRDVDSRVKLLPSASRLLDPLLLRRTLVELRAPDLTVYREDPAGTMNVIVPEDWRFSVRLDGRVVGEYRPGERSISIEREKFGPTGGFITLDVLREEDGRRDTPRGDTLYYRTRRVEQRERSSWILPGSLARERGSATYRAFLQLVALEIASDPELSVRISLSGPGAIDRSALLSDLLEIAGRDYGGSITTDSLPADHPLASPPWNDGVVITLEQEFLASVAD